MSWKKTIGPLLITIGPLIYITFFTRPNPQDLGYHNFADTTEIFSIPNFHNVVTNLIFIIVSIIGLKIYKKQQKHNSSWLSFLISVLIVAPGSAYYHLTPNNETLFWDRLPMTIGFISLTCFAMFEVHKVNKQIIPLFISQLIGLSALFYWVVNDDLRFYLWVQGVPVILLAYIAFIISTPSLRPKPVLMAVILYIAAKLTESHDHEIYEILGYSGHSIKHLLAGFAVFFLIQSVTSSKKRAS